jgi:hypothetical protein
LAIILNTLLTAEYLKRADIVTRIIVYMRKKHKADKKYAMQRKDMANG